MPIPQGTARVADMIYFPKIESHLQRYDISKSYAWNYEHAPQLPDSYILEPADRDWTLCGVKVNSPLAIAAGPLLNGRWVLHYASIGFDVLTYKTVRSVEWPSYATPNLQPIRTVELGEAPTAPVRTSAKMQGSWAVSFGMPSKSPDLWRFDVEETRRLLPTNKHLSVSVVATPEEDWTINQIADDYAKCAYWAMESGADFVELNFSCPNVVTRDGQLYQNGEVAGIVARRARERIGGKPLLIKIGCVADRQQADSLVTSLTGVADALVMINCIPAQVEHNGQLMFQGQRRGIAGPAIYSAVLKQLAMFKQSVTEADSPLEIVGVGGISQIEQVEQCLARGAAGVQIATSVML